MAKDDDPDVGGTQSQPHETLGNAPSNGPDPGPPPVSTTGGSPTPASSIPPVGTTGGSPTPASRGGGRNMPLLVGIGVAVLAIIAIIIGVTR